MLEKSRTIDAQISAGPPRPAWAAADARINSNIDDFSGGPMAAKLIRP
jgi:hypothetical protein